MEAQEIAMDKAVLDHLTEQFGQQIRERFPDAPIKRYEVLQYGDDPEVEPGQLMARVILEAPADQEGRRQVLETFHDTHRAAFHDLRRDLDQIREVGFLEFVAGDVADGSEGGPRLRLGHRAEGGPALPPDGPLVPVMARLGPADLETVDTLITAGIATNRADAVRWALARIRERPAYAQLVQKTREITDLKAQF
jgi:hypothetical protein